MKKLRKINWYSHLKHVLLILLLTALLAMVFPDRYLLKKFFAFRGNRVIPTDIHLVAISGIDREAPLKLLPMENISNAVFEKLLSSILNASPKKIYIDGSILPIRADEPEQQRVDRLLSLQNVIVYSEVIKKEQDYLPIKTEKTYPIYAADQLVSVYPYKRGYINFYGHARSLPVFTFSDILLAENDISVLKDKNVFIGRFTSVFINGQVPTKHFHVPASPDEMPSLEIQATVFKNSVDNSYIKSLPAKKVYFVITLTLTFIISILFSCLNFKLALPLFLTIITTALLVTYQMFLKFYWLDGITILLSLPCSALFATAIKTLFSTGTREIDRKKQFFLD